VSKKAFCFIPSKTVYCSLLKKSFFLNPPEIWLGQFYAPFLTTLSLNEKGALTCAFRDSAGNIFLSENRFLA
jgi:hypothetical protein